MKTTKVVKWVLLVIIMFTMTSSLAGIFYIPKGVPVPEGAEAITDAKTYEEAEAERKIITEWDGTIDHSSFINAQPHDEKKCPECQARFHREREFGDKIMAFFLFLILAVIAAGILCLMACCRY